MKILAIESSCDETAAAVIVTDGDRPSMASSIVSSQINIHRKYGGVVPEVAARAHIQEIIPVIKSALKKSQTNLRDIDYLAVTQGPGLVGSLVVGVETAKAISLAAKIPLIFVNHLEGHIYANFLGDGEIPKFPVVSLLVSGGHTVLILMKKHGTYKIIGQTRDDAAGEAFDKGAKIMGLGYPGGPAIATLASAGDENKFHFPIIDLTPKPKRNKLGYLERSEPSLDFSFSGIKTALLNVVKKNPDIVKTNGSDLAASYQKAIIDNLTQNVFRALKKHQPETFILAGGVAANERLRDSLEKIVLTVSPETTYRVPDFSLCTDNAAMIGAAAFYKIRRTKIKSQGNVAEPGLKLRG